MNENSTLKEIFNEKKKYSEKFSQLRKWQDKFCEYYEKNDIKSINLLGIDIPTGFGKTLIGLLIGQEALNKGKTCAIITQTHALIDKLEKEANELKIPTVYIPTNSEIRENQSLKTKRRIGEFKFSRAQAIRISTYDAELKSDLPPEDVLIIDDADMFVQNLQDQTKITIKKKNYPDLHEYLLEEINKENYQELDSIINETSSYYSYQLLYQNDAIKLQEKLQEKIPNLKTQCEVKIKDGDDLFFKLFWEGGNYILEYLPNFLVYVNSREISLTLPFLNPEQQRLLLRQRTIFMSATLGYPEYLSQKLGISDEIKMIDLETLEIEKRSMGERIIFPIDDDNIAETEDYIDRCLILAKNYNKILFLLYTSKEQFQLQNAINEIGKKSISYNNLEDIELFLKREENHLLSAGRYIGMDLSIEEEIGTPCQVAVISQIPKYISFIDHFYREISGRKEISDEIIAHRLIQSFGRCNRNEDNQAAYFVLDYSFARSFTQNIDYITYLNKDIKIAINQGFHSFGGLLSEAIPVANNFLRGSKPDKLEYEPPAKAPSKKIYSDIFSHELKAWSSFILQNYQFAIRNLNIALAEIAKKLNQKEINDTVQRYHTWLHYFKCMIYEALFNKQPNEENWNNLQRVINNLSLVSEDVFFNKYIHQDRLIPKFEQKIQKKSSSIESDLRNPEILFKGVWEIPYVKPHQIFLKNALDNIIQNDYELGINDLIPKFEEIIRNIYFDHGGSSTKPTLSPMIDFFRKEELICLNTLNYFNNMPNDFNTIRNELLHSLAKTDESTECFKTILYLIDGIVYLINDIYFSQMLKNLLDADEIKKSVTEMFIKMIPSNSLERWIFNLWYNSSKAFQPNPSRRKDPLFYKGILILKSKTNSERIEIELNYNEILI